MLKFNCQTRYVDDPHSLIKVGKYPNGRIALSVYSSSGEILHKCTSNLPDFELPEGYVFIKDYSENEGILTCLLNQQIVEEPIKLVFQGHAQFYMCKLNPNKFSKELPMKE